MALVTDYDCWRPRTGGPDAGAESLLAEIIANIERATHVAMALIAAALKHPETLGRTPSPAHTALQLGIWTPKDAIDPQVVDRLGPIWGHRFKGK